jgi:hexosaminidase
MRARLSIAVAVAATVVIAQPYYWRYPSTDAENEDIRCLPCGAGCTLAELEAACTADAACVAFNTHGWLKKSISDMAPDSCDLYVKKSMPPSPSPSPPPPPPIPFWPLPVQVTYSGRARLTVSPALAFTLSPPANADLAAACARILPLMFAHGAPAAPAGAATSVLITVDAPATPLSLYVDESYTLSIPLTGAIRITAVTNFGAYHALQTLSQAVRYDFNADVYTVAATPLDIADAPKFAWRGILVDTDRHWHSLASLKAIIDGMTYAKLNIVHWHIVDWQSWPLQSAALPLLWAASWSPRERYSFEDVRAVVEYARARGVRVVPEFDTPGHASSMCVSYPALCCGPHSGSAPLTPVPDAAGKNITLDSVAAVIGEIAAITPDEFFHLGGDEVSQGCWNNTPAVRAWMAAHNYSTTDEVYEYLVAAVDASTIALGKSPIRWEEVWKHFGTALDPRTVVHAWLSSGALIDATSKGYRAIWSVDGQYYLDALGENWEGFYNVDILRGVTNASAIPLILGGETEMWGETADGSDVQQTIFPRAAAAAERQWSYDVVTTSDAAYVLDRLKAFRCLLLERGIAAAPVTNAQARAAPTGPGSCLS